MWLACMLCLPFKIHKGHTNTDKERPFDAATNSPQQLPLKRRSSFPFCQPWNQMPYASRPLAAAASPTFESFLLLLLLLLQINPL